MSATTGHTLLTTRLWTMKVRRPHGASSMTKVWSQQLGVRSKKTHSARGGLVRRIALFTHEKNARESFSSRVRYNALLCFLSICE